MVASSILSLIPTMQSMALLADNVKGIKKKKFKPVKQGVKNIVGINLIRATAQSL